MQEALRERVHLCGDEIKVLVPENGVCLVKSQVCSSARHDSIEGIISGLGNPP